MMKDLITEIQKLSLTENDILVVKGNHPMSRGQLDRLEIFIEKSINLKIKAICVSKDTTFEKISKSEAKIRNLVGE